MEEYKEPFSFRKTSKMIKINDWNTMKYAELIKTNHELCDFILSNLSSDLSESISALEQNYLDLIVFFNENRKDVIAFDFADLYECTKKIIMYEDIPSNIL